VIHYIFYLISIFFQLLKIKYFVKYLILHFEFVFNTDQLLVVMITTNFILQKPKIEIRFLFCFIDFFCEMFFIYFEYFVGCVVLAFKYNILFI